MFTLSSVLYYFVQKPITEENPIINPISSHPFRSKKYKEECFPQSVQFLDFQWTPKGLSGQLRGVMSGLKPLPWDCLVQVDPRTFIKEINLKKVLFDKSNKYFKMVTAGLETRIDAQKELLDLILTNLKEFHNEHYEITNEYVKVLLTNDTFWFSEFEKEPPILLLTKLVQEDFIILEFEEADGTWRFISGAAAFSFVEIGINGEKSFMKPGNDVAKIHSPVPGFNPTIYKQVSSYFKALKADTAYWRANWVVTPLEGISPFEEEILEGSTIEGNRQKCFENETKSSYAIPDLGNLPMTELAIRSEYQTIFKLPKSGCLVFGIHSYIDPLDKLKKTPKAADMIGRATSNMNEKTLKYRGVNQRCKENIVNFCNQLAKDI